MLLPLLLALACQGNAPVPSEAHTIRGRVIIPENLPASERYLVVTTGEGVAEPAHVRPDAEGHFELTVQATEGPIGLNLWAR
ncbi:MAG: hypothetical protein AAF368_10835, partial [Planctomycetota bacterium]